MGKNGPFRDLDFHSSGLSWFSLSCVRVAFNSGHLRIFEIEASLKKKLTKLQQETDELIMLFPVACNCQWGLLSNILALHLWNYGEFNDFFFIGSFTRLVGSVLPMKFRPGLDESVNTSGPLNIMTSFQTLWLLASRWGTVTQWLLSSLQRVLPRSLLAVEWSISTRWVSENTTALYIAWDCVEFPCIV